MSHGLTSANETIKNRGPRFAVKGTIRGGEFAVELADTADRAEEILTRMEADGYRNVRLHLPDSTIDYTSVARGLAEARDRLNNATEVARAAANRLTEAGISEAQTARMLGVDRMSIRSWIGK